MLLHFYVITFNRIYYTCLKTHLTENVFSLTLTLTLKHNNIFGIRNDSIFSRKCTETLLVESVDLSYYAFFHQLL